PAVPLVERRLRLDDADGPGGGADDDVDEAVETVGVVAQAPPLEHRARRVEAEHQRPELRPGLGEAGSERLHEPSIAQVVGHPSALQCSGRMPRVGTPLLAASYQWKTMSYVLPRRRMAL